jgi:hypothetical protein
MTPDIHAFRRLVLGLLVPAVALGAASAAFSQATLVSNSPFAPNGTAVSGSRAPAEAYELTGSSVEGPDVTVCIYERQAKHSQWIPVGGDEDGVRVVSYDPQNDTAVVVIAGARKELAMRKATVAAVGPMAASRPVQSVYSPAAPTTPIASAPPVVTGTAAQEQREARMLVSDLLEIGIQQRKAYQEAKQRAAAGTPAPPEN